jgi:photosystem II stability/assembly factor-like uncharacterized protein
MKKYFILMTMLALLSCKKEEKEPIYIPSFTIVKVDTLMQDKISIRALLTDGDKVWYAGNGGKYGYVSLSGGKSLNGVVAKDSALPEFRSIAKNKSDIFILNAGTPAMLYKISKDGMAVRKVYTETGEKVFYDSMQFYNDTDGIAMGDPTDGCLSVIITEDGGGNWRKVSCEVLPETANGEAAFAASNSNLIIKGDNTWMVSGGKKSRVFYSADRGKSWKVYDTPMAQGSEMTGIFSADFYDDKIGFAVGGDYEKPDKNSGNKILTINGGKDWQLVGEGAGFGYASCVQFVPDGNGNELVTCGPSGIFYSFDRGATWKKILDDKTLHTLRFADNKTIIAAGQGKIIRIKLQ